MMQSSPELFERDVRETLPPAPEQAFREDTRHDQPPSPPAARPIRAKRSLAWLERAIAEANAREAEPQQQEAAKQDDAPAVEPSAPPRAEPPLPERRRDPERTTDERKLGKAVPNRAWRDATNVALAVGAIGAGVRAGLASSNGDGTQGDSVVSATFLTIGLVGFATAGVLYLIEPSPPKDNKVMVKLAGVGLVGSF